MSKLTRKEFLQRLAAMGVGTVAAGSIFSSCGGGEAQPQKAAEAAPASPPKADDPCADVSALAPEEKATRTTFKYVAHTPDPNKHCANCALYIKPAEGAACGGCQIVKGPINPDGYCMNWVAPM